jgi:hypothetical protein
MAGVTCASSVHHSLSAQARGAGAVKDEDDDVYSTKAVISFSLKCLKVGMGRQWGPAGHLYGHARQSASSPAFHAGQEGLPPCGMVRLQNPMCFLPCCGPLPRAAAPQPLHPSPPVPTTESKTFQPSQGQGILSECLPRTSGPVA